MGNLGFINQISLIISITLLTREIVLQKKIVKFILDEYWIGPHTRKWTYEHFIHHKSNNLIFILLCFRGAKLYNFSVYYFLHI